MFQVKTRLRRSRAVAASAANDASMRSAIDDLLVSAAAHESDFEGPRALIPSKHVALVTCMDSRIDTFRIFGLESGEAHILRNAGGLATDDMLRSLVLSQRLLQTREIILMHHTNCGLHRMDEPALNAAIAADMGYEPLYKFGSFADVDVSVRERDPARARTSGVTASRPRARLRLRSRNRPPARGRRLEGLRLRRGAHVGEVRADRFLDQRPALAFDLDDGVGGVLDPDRPEVAERALLDVEQRRAHDRVVGDEQRRDVDAQDARKRAQRAATSRSDSPSSNDTSAGRSRQVA